MDGTVKCWGDNRDGQLGDESKSARTNPVSVSGIRNTTSISLGSFHSCALSDGKVKCWGSDDYGQLRWDHNLQHHSCVGHHDGNGHFSWWSPLLCFTAGW